MQRVETLIGRPHRETSTRTQTATVLCIVHLLVGGNDPQIINASYFMQESMTFFVGVHAAFHNNLSANEI